MTISSEAIKSSIFAGNGSTTAFAIPFKTFSHSDLSVTLMSASGVEAIKILTTHYTVNLNSNQDNTPGGTVVMVTPPASGERLVIVNEPSYTQSSDLVNGGGFFPNVIEDMVDRATILSKRAHELAARSISIPISDSSTTAELPTETLRASKAIVFDSSGNVSVSADNYVDQVATVAASASAAASSASAASSSATSSASSASSASTSAAAAATSYDNFDDRFLGAKSSDPSIDNDGDTPIITGALYFNSSNNVMMVYTGSAWVRTTPTSSDQTKINTVSGIASDVSAVAGKETEIGLLGTTDAIADMNTLGTADVVSDMNVLATADIVSDMNVLGTADVVADMNTLAVADVIADMNTLGTADIVSDMNTLGTAGNVTAMGNCSTDIANINTVSGSLSNVNLVATNITGVNSFADRYRVSATAPVTSLDQGDLYFDTTTNELRSYGTSWQATSPSAPDQASINIVAGELVYEEDLGSIADALTTSTGNNISDVADDIANVNTVAGLSSEISNLNGISSAISTVSGISSNVTSVANNEANVNRYADEYSITSTVPSSPSAGDLWYDLTNNVLKYYTGSVFASISAGISDVVSDSSPELGGDLNCLNYNITNTGTISGADLQIDFGGLT